jgi:multidrug resistance efflux pump
MEGVVFQVHVTPEQKVAAQEEVVRLEQQPRQLELERANALLRAEQLTPLEGGNSELREARS